MKALLLLAFLFIFLVSPALSAGLFFPLNIVLRYIQKINSAIKRKDSNPIMFQTTDKFYDCLKKSGNITTLMLNTVYYQMKHYQTIPYINITHDYEYVLISDYTEEEQKGMNKLFKICAILHPFRFRPITIARLIQPNPKCEYPQKANDCIEEIVNKSNKELANQLHDAFYSPESETRAMRSNTTIKTENEQDWIDIIKNIIYSEDPEHPEEFKYPGVLECLVNSKCNEFIGFNS